MPFGYFGTTKLPLKSTLGHNTYGNNSVHLKKKCLL